MPETLMASVKPPRRNKGPGPRKAKSSPPLVSIVVLCHNDWAYLKRCLASISRHTKPGSHEIIIVDNASTDGARPHLRRLRARKNVKVIFNDQNRYFAGGNNDGILISRGRYVLLLNADVVVGPGWLERLLRCAESDPAVGIVAPCTNHAAGIQLVKKPGYSSLRSFPAFADRWAKCFDGQVVPAHRLIGFCLLIKREVVDTIGVLDERFGPGGYEDYDYCMRARQAGYSLAVAKDVFIHHFGGKGYVGVDYDRLRLFNRELLARKWSDFIIMALDDLDDYFKKPLMNNLTPNPASRLLAKAAGPRSS